MEVLDRLKIYCLAGFVVLYAVVSNAEGEYSLCLYSEGKGGGHNCTGINDPENLGENKEVLRLIEFMGLPKEKIKFVGCEDGRFSTADLSPESSEHDYRISYPVLKNSPDGVGANSPYIAPITHELSHVLQIELSGSIEEMKSKRENKNIELAADFISGIVYSRTGKKQGINDYQQNLSLVGMYKEEAVSAHGTWAQRTIAFRRGVFLKPDPDPIGIRSADSVFQAEVYGELLDVEKTASQESSSEYDPHLNKISACAETDKLYEELEASGTEPIGRCRSPHGVLERTIKNFISKDLTSKVCFLSEPPSSILDGFSCFQLTGRLAVPNVTCVRPADNSVIVDHFNDKHMNEGALYMAKASTCGAGVDSSVALPTLMPPLLNFISKFEFGYIRSLGNSVPVSAQMQHGYASLDPSLNLDGEKAIEYVSMFSGGLTEPFGSDRRVGDWVINVDNAPSLSSELNKMSKGHAFFNSVALSFRRSTGSGPVAQSKNELMSAWNDKVVDQLKDEGFEIVPESKLKLADGKDFKSAIKEIELGKPYGLRNISLFDSNYSYKVMLNKDAPPCTWDQKGIMMGVVMAHEPKPGRETDYGSISLLVIGVGACSQHSNSSIKYIETLVPDIAESVVEMVGEE